MIGPERSPPFRRRAKFNKQTLLQMSIASALATAGVLVTAPAADARTTKLEITSRTIAFGGSARAGRRRRTA